VRSIKKAIRLSFAPADQRRHSNRLTVSDALWRYLNIRGVIVPLIHDKTAPPIFDIDRVSLFELRT